MPLAAGAYNAGPRAMARWCEQHGKHPTDEFVELIAFAQTREYVKRVTEPLREVPLPLRPDALRDPADPQHQGRPTGPTY